MIIIYTRYGMNLGGVGIILNKILKEINLNREIFLIHEDELTNNNLLKSKIPNHINLIELKNQEKYKNSLIGKTLKKIIKIKSIKNLGRVIDRIINFYFRKKKLMKKQSEVIIDFEFILSGLIKDLISKKKIVWIHNNPDIYSKKQKANLKYYDKIIVISEEMKEKLIEFDQDLKNKIELIYNPIDLLGIQKKSLEKINLPNEDYFISVMRMELKQKDFETIFKSLVNLENKNIKHYFLGDGPDRNKIERMIKYYNLEKRVVLLGNIENPYPWIKHAKLFVHSSTFEGFPGVLIESLILGTPIVSSNCSTGVKEILDFGRQGMLFEIGNDIELSEKINTILENNELYEGYIEKNIMWRNKFMTDDSIKKITELLTLKN